MRVLGQECCGGHDLARLAEAALRYAELDPRLLTRMAAVVRQPLDGGDPGERRHADVGDARARGAPIEMDRTGTALRDAAAELRPLEAQNVAQDPQQGHVAVYVDSVQTAVDVELKHRH